MVKNKRNSQKQEQIESDNKVIETLLNFAIEDNEPSTSSHAEKRLKLTQRRDAIDERILDQSSINAGNTIVDAILNGQKKSVAVQTEFTSKEISIDRNDFIDFKNEMKEMVENSNSDTKKLKRSVLYEVKKMHEDVVFYLTSRSNSSSLSEIKEKINITEPIKTLETFMEFDSKIHSDKDHAEGLRAVLELKSRAKNLSEAICTCLGTIMSPELQLLFSGCGKSTKGVSKENFSATRTYMELKEYLMKQFPAEKESEVLSKTSRWLANARDRQHGRKHR